MPAGPALLALRTKAPLITAFVSYTDTGIHIEFNTVVLPASGEKKRNGSRDCSDDCAAI